MKLAETATQLQILSERASYIFDDILQLAASLDERIESLARKVEKSNGVEKFVAPFQQDCNLNVTSSADRSIPQFLIPATRDERYWSKQCWNFFVVATYPLTRVHECSSRLILSFCPSVGSLVCTAVRRCLKFQH
jgi:hypothetical protein